jgi:hypothetical protein
LKGPLLVQVMAESGAVKGHRLVSNSLTQGGQGLSVPRGRVLRSPLKWGVGR